jgi:hypothetical protein
MTDVFHVYICNSEGERVNRVYDAGVRIYAMNAINAYQNSTNAKLQKLVTLCVDLLNYGTASQNQFGGNLTDLADSEMTESQKALASDYSSAAYVYTKNGAAAGVAIALENRIELYFQFDKTKVNTTDINKLYAVLTYQDLDGNEVQEVISGSAGITDAGYLSDYSTSRWRVALTNLPSSYCDQVVKCELYLSDDDVLEESECVGYATESVSGYLGRAITAYNTDIYYKILRYVKSARAYFVG